MTKFTNFIQAVTALAKNNKGATAIEYALIAALIAVAIITAVGFVGDDVDSTFQSISTSLSGS